MPDEIITIAELESYTRVPFDSAASFVAGGDGDFPGVIGMCQGTLEAHLNRSVTVRRFTEERRVGVTTFRGLVGVQSAPDSIYLAYTPITAVASVIVDDELIDPTMYVVQSYGLSDILFSGDLATIHYDGGYDGRAREHSALMFAVLRAAKREMLHYFEGDFGVEDLRSEGYHVKFVDPAAVFTQKELQAVARYQKKTFAR